MFDQDEKKELTFKEIKDALGLEDEIVKRIIATVDESKDGIVQFDEFKNMMIKLD